MIRSKKDLSEYMYLDKIALRIPKNKKRPSPFKDEVWKFEIALRKAEYAENCLNSIIYLPYKLYLKLKFHRMSVRCGFSIPLNVFDAGLSIAHYGTIVVNSAAKVGRFCRIQEGVNIGASGGDLSPQIGDYVFIGSGAKIIGDVKIGNHVAVGAGAVVTRTCEENSVTLAGVPAKKISDNNSDVFLCKAIFEEDRG